MSSSANKTRQEALDLLHAATPKALLEVYNEPYKVNKEQIQEYRNNGFITLKRVLYGEALSHAQKVITAAVEIRKDHDKRTLAEKSQYEQSFLQYCVHFDASDVRNATHTSCEGLQDGAKIDTKYTPILS
jgi:hypothetical protein